MVEVQAWFCQCQITVLSRLGTRSAECLTHGLTEITHLNNDPVLPVRQVIQPDPGRRNIIAQIPAAFFQQGFNYRNQGGRSGAARNLTFSPLGSIFTDVK